VRVGAVNRLYLADSDASFRLYDEGGFSTHADTSAAIAVADYDRDGDLDILVANWGSPGSVSRLDRNTTTGRNRIIVELEGTRSNRMGVGTRVSILLTSSNERRWNTAGSTRTRGTPASVSPPLRAGHRDARRFSRRELAIRRRGSAQRRTCKHAAAHPRGISAASRESAR
jgi:hypothetical protein